MSDYLRDTESFLCGLFYGAISHTGFFNVRGKMIGEWYVGKDWKGSDRGVIAVISWHLCVSIEENREITHWCRGRDWNRIPAEHKTRSLRLCQSAVGQFVLRVFI